MNEKNNEMKSLLNITQYPSKLQGKVSYPKVHNPNIGINDVVAHKWFTENMKKIALRKFYR